MSGIDFSQIQHAVGQGGFHTGWLFDPADPPFLDPFIGNPGFAWAYDCGSNQTDILHARVQLVRDAHFNVLFLSHLDADHVNGIDNLLGLATADEVVLPYLGDDDWALHLAGSLSSGSFTGTLADLAADPAGWFGSRGVSRLTYIETDDDTDEDRAEPDPVAPGPMEGPVDPDGVRGRERPIKLLWSRPLEPDLHAEAGSGSGSGSGSGPRAQVVRVRKGGVATLNAAGRTINWILSPFAYRPSPAKLVAFKAELAKRLGPGLTAAAYAEAARTAAGRKALRYCYDAVWKNHNLHSMALYAGPAQPLIDKIHNTAWRGHFHRRVIQPGWVSTGDFDTSVAIRRDKLLHYYAGYAQSVGQFSLPHHGSDASFDSTILAAFPNLLSTIVAVGPNSHGHPGRTAQAAVAALPSVDFVRVDDNISSMYRVCGRVAF